MGLRIQTNIQSMNAQRNLVTSTEANGESIAKLSSGFRINKASDDAAGLAISEKLKADIRGLNMAKRNANDGISLVQTAEGGLSEIGSILGRLRELGVQAASDTIGPKERTYLNKEYFALKDEIDRITSTTEFNGTRLLVGNQEDLPESLQNAGNPYPLEIQVGKDYFTDVDGLDVEKPTNVFRLDLQTYKMFTEGEDGLNLGSTDNTDGTSVETKLGAQESLSRVDIAIGKVAEFRSYLGSIQSRLGSSVNNLSVQSENLSAANSRIRDTDYADETAKLTQSGILKNAGISVLAQANQSPQAALQLLQ